MTLRTPPRRILNVGVRSSLLGTVAAVADACGGNAVARWCHRHRLTVLCYHGVVAAIPAAERYLFRNSIDADRFDRQMAHLSRRFTPVGLDAVIAAAVEGERLPERAVLVSFDDGYRNNLRVAAPILAAHELPAMFAITTGLIGSPAAVLWPLEIDLRILAAGRTVPVPNRARSTRSDDRPMTVQPPTDLDGRIELARRVRGICKDLDDEARRRYLDRLRDAAPALERNDERDDFLSWDEVRELRDRGFSIASHTVAHPILSRTTDERLREEVVSSKRVLETELGRDCRAFVYPNGNRHDMSLRTRGAIEAAGYSVAFSLCDTVNPRQLADRLAIDRISMPNHAGMARWRGYVSGLRTTWSGGRR